jgi:hypothetical protein
LIAAEEPKENHVKDVPRMVVKPWPVTAAEAAAMAAAAAAAAAAATQRRKLHTTRRRRQCTAVETVLPSGRHTSYFSD